MSAVSRRWVYIVFSGSVFLWFLVRWHLQLYWTRKVLPCGCSIFPLAAHPLVAPSSPRGVSLQSAPCQRPRRDDQGSSTVCLLHPHPCPHCTIAGSSWTHLALPVPFCRCRG